MKYTMAWARTAAQNVTLKLATVLLGLVVVVQLMVIAGLADRQPLVIDRGCLSRLSQFGPGEASPAEIQNFIYESIPARFDSQLPANASVLSGEELAKRQKEQAQMQARGIQQRVLVDSVRVTDGKVEISATRILGVGKVKSALPFELSANVQRTNRTESNPYGLVLTGISMINEKDSK